MYKKRIILIILLLTVLAAVAASCKTEGGSADDTVSLTENDGQGGESSPDDLTDKPERIPSDLPDADFGGKLFKVLGCINSTYDQFTNFEIDAESVNGERVNDAVYNRNRALEEKYNVVIAQDLLDDPQGTLQKLVKAGDDNYSLAFLWTQNGAIGNVAMTGAFYNLNSMKYLDFEKPWWNKEINGALSVNNKLYFTTSDFAMQEKARTFILAFNKTMAQDYNLGNLYDLVYEGKWTVDKMLEFTKDVAIDLDGDGKMTDADQWALGMSNYDSFANFYVGCDNYIVTKDNGDNPVLSVNNDHTMASIDKILRLANDKTMAYYCPEFQGKVSYDYWYTMLYMFYEERLLFCETLVHTLKDITQASDVNFGVLPFPKYDESQKSYISTPDAWWASLFGIPAIVQDADFASFMLEALSAASKYDVLPEYIEVSVKTKYTVDEDSVKMLETIFDGARYDLGRIYNWGSIGSLFIDTIPRAGANNFSSQYEKIQGKVESAMQKTVDTFKELP